MTGTLELVRRAKRLVGAAVRRRAKTEHLWSVGVYEGDSLFDWRPAGEFANPVLTRQDVTDVSAAFVADPFAIRVGDSWHMFFEVMNREQWKGEIGWATSSDFRQWTYQQIVLREPFHLSYPYVFEWQGEYYMIPEAHKTSTLRLYKALEFPTHWTLVGTLLSGRRFSDASIFGHGGRWWLLVESAPDFKFDTLRLYHATDLLGGWKEHPRSPVVQGNPHIARPAGIVVTVDGRIVHFAQDCHPRYGLQVFAFEIVELTPTTYRERPAGSSAILTGGGAHWNKGGMHHIDAHRDADGRWMAVVDGWFRATPNQLAGKA